MSDQELFNPLDPLGPEYGRINQPIPDAKGLSAFEGDLIDMPKANIPTRNETYFPAFSNIDNLNRPNREIKHNLVKSNAVNPSIPKKPIDINQYNKSTAQYIQSFFQANQDKNSYAKIYSYNAGPDGNAFYKRYAAYGQKKFDEIGFSPLRDNEANFNARTTRWDDFSRMMTHSFVPLFTRGFVSGPKSLAKMLKGDFTSADLEDAKIYEEAAAIGNSSKGGIFGFANNTVMNFGYTAGIITEAIAEEAAGALLAAPTGGTSLFATTANNIRKIPNLFRGINSTKKGYDAVRKTLNLTETLNGARSFWNSAKSSEFLRSSVNALNPLENTMHAIKGFKQADNLTDLAILYKTAGGFYRDVRKINMALSEARLEAGMVENNVYNKLYNEAYLANDNQVPNNKELAEIEKQAKNASYKTLIENTGIIYVSNGITFHNITGPRGGIRNFIKSTTDDITEIAAREGEKNFGKLGKVIYDKTAKKFAFEKNNLKTLAKGWLKNPIHKSAINTVGYFKANFTEGIQENLQETIAQANEKYFIDSYKSPTLQTMLYSRAAMGLIGKDRAEYQSEAWAEQNPFTAKGFETFASGFFMGTLAGPLNNAVPFLSSTYNRMFNKEQYEKWKTKQTNVATDLVKTLNEIDLQKLMSVEIENLGVQDLVGQVRARENKKAGLDSEVESYITHVEKLKQTGTFGIFKEKLEELKTATDEEFADAVNIDLEQVPKYRTRIDKSIARLDKIKNLYEKIEKKNPNPIDLSRLDKEDPNYSEKIYLYKAWNTINRNMVFFNETYDDILRRRAQIDQKFNSNPKFQKISNRQRNIIFNPINPEGQLTEGDMKEEIILLKRELESEKELTKDQNKIKILEEQIRVTQDYIDKYSKFDKFFNRASYANQYAEEIKKNTGKEPTTEEIIKYMEDDLGGNTEDGTKSIEILKELKDSYTNYIKTLGKQKGSDIFNEDIDLTFDLLLDYYKLGHEKQTIGKYVDLLNDQDAFLDAVRRNSEWIRVQDNKRVKYFEDLIRSEMDKVRANALLNSLADKGLYISLDDLENFLNMGIPPKDIYNNITKQLYKIGSEEYKNIFNEFFSKYNNLKSDLNPNKTGIVDEALRIKVEALEKEMNDEIEKLNKKPTRTETGTIKTKQGNKTISINDVIEQLNNEEYVELRINKDSEPLILFKDKDDNIRLDNVDGEIIDTRKIKDRFSESKKYKIEMLPDPLEVERITNIYNAKIEDAFKAYIADKESVDLEVPYEEVTQESNLNTPDLTDFKNELYDKYLKEYVSTLSPKEKEELSENSDLDNETFEKWYSLPENKKYFDEYNNKNRPTISDKETVININGVSVDTKNRTIEQLIEIRDSLADQLTIENQDKEYLDEKTEKEEIKAAEKRIDGLALNLKNLNTIILARKFAQFPESMKDSIRSIQKLFKAQDKVEKGVTLTEDDEITGLKKGEKAYRINGKFFRRVTKAMYDVLPKTYKYNGQVDVDTVFNQTIGKRGLNPESIKDFVDSLRILGENVDKLPGTNKIFFDNLQDQLLLLPVLSAEQIKLEKQKDEILDKANEEKDLVKQQALFDQAEEIQNKIDGVTTAPVSDNADNTISNGDKIISVQTKPVTNEIKNTNGELFLTADNDPEGRIYINMEPLKDILVVPNNTLTIIDKKTGKEIINKELNSEGSVIFEAMQGRFFVVAKINGQLVPFYKSSAGTSGKTQGDWYPFFGYTGAWLVKGGIDKATGKMSYSPEIDRVTDILNENLVFPDKYINRVTNTVKDTDGNTMFDFNDFFKVNRLWQKVDNISTGSKANYFIKRLKENTRSESGAVALITGLNTTELDSSDTPKANSEWFNLINKNIELAALEGTAQPTTKDNFDTATKKNTTKNIIDAFFGENTYEDSRVAGNFFDLAKDYLESGKKPEFNEKKITREAYDSLIAYLDTIKKRVDSGELYIVGRDLVVYDEIDHGDFRRDRIAGEIDLVMVDKEGIYVVDIKSGESDKFLNFNNLSTKEKVFSKREEYTLQTAIYATMLERNIDKPVKGIAMLPIERESNKINNSVISAGEPLRGNMYNKIVYKKDNDGKIIINKNLDPKTKQPYNEKQFTITKDKFEYDFLVPLYRESVQEEIDKLLGKREGLLVPGAKRALSNKYKLFREKLNEITDEESKENINKIKRVEKLINTSVEKDGITIPTDIANLLQQKKQALRSYTGKETIESTIEKYEKRLKGAQEKLDSQTKTLKETKSNISFDDIDSKAVDKVADEQYALDGNFAYYYDKHSEYENEFSKNATKNQQLAITVMKQSGLLTDSDIEDDFIDELLMADASELIHEGVKRIQYLKAETDDSSIIKGIKEYQSRIFNLMTSYSNVSKAQNTVSVLKNAKLNAENNDLKSAYDALAIEIKNLEYELRNPNLKTKDEKVKKYIIENIEEQIDDINNFREALALAYEIPIDVFETFTEEGVVEEDEYSNEIKKGDEVYSRSSSDITIYKVKEVTSKNIILEDEKGKEIKVEIGKFDEQYITKSEMNAGETTPPGYNPTEGEKDILNKSQMSVDDFIRNGDEEKVEAYQQGVSNTPAQNRKNLLDKTKDCP